MNKKEYNEYFRKYGHPPKRKCKECGVDVGKGKSYCSDCMSLRNGSRKTLFCGYKGCEERRHPSKRSCLYHTKHNRDFRHMNQIVWCQSCMIELGRRKDFKHTKFCKKCKYERVRDYQSTYYKDRYNNDEEYRKSYREYQTNYKKKMIKG